MPVGEVGEVEGLPGAVVLLNDEAPMVGIDRDDLGGITVVARELEPVAGAEPLLDVDNGLYLGA